MTLLDRIKNTALVFLIICILGGISGVHLHNNDIRLMPHIKNTLNYPAQAWQSAKDKTTQLTQLSFMIAKSINPETDKFKGLELKDISIDLPVKNEISAKPTESFKWISIENITIERRIRYIRDIQNIDIFAYFGRVAEIAHNKWQRVKLNTALVTNYIVGGIWNKISAWYSSVNNTLQTLLEIPAKVHQYSFGKAAQTTQFITKTITGAYSYTADTISSIVGSVVDSVSGAYSSATNSINGTYNTIKNAIISFHTASVSGMAKAIDRVTAIPRNIYAALTHTWSASVSGMDKAINKAVAVPQNIYTSIANTWAASQDVEFKNILSYEPAAGTPKPQKFAEVSDGGTIDGEYKKAPEDETEKPEYRYAMEQKTLEIEGVLVPQNATVISSSRDGQIAKINFDNGDMFQKGDILIEYDCDDLKAELEAAEAEKQLTGKRSMRNNKLFKLDIISDIEDLGFKTEDIKASAQAKIIEHRMEQCYIRAAYDGRVTNRLANEHEFTRTDRVLMEVASLDDLEIEFLVPSIWLRWVNVDAPIGISINETGENYDAVINRIYGEIDPVSQSIQMSAKLQPYSSPLLPGMSGTITLDVARIRDAGIKGFLEQPRYAGSGGAAE